MAIRTVSSDPDFFISRYRALFEAVLEENDGRPLQLARAKADGTPVEWYMSQRYRPHDLRVVLTDETVFDIGDQLSWANWDEIAALTNRLWKILREQNVPFWGALSGGKGTHTHVFVRPRGYRQYFTRAVMGLLRSGFEDGPEVTIHEIEVDVDGGHLNPNEDAKLIREFGAKKAFRKTLFCTLTDFREIQLSREKTYREAGMSIPVSLPIAEQPIGVYHRIVAEAFDAPCPRSRRCYEMDGIDIACTSCPAMK